MRLPLYVVNAFAEQPFSGNPAAVCLPGVFPEPRLMQAIAAQNNLSETAFVVRDGKGWQIRWFTPTAEVDLCGHATLAAAAVVLRFEEPDAHAVAFESAGGPLNVSARGDDLVLDFPARPPVETDAAAIDEALGVRAESCWAAEGNHMAVLGDEGTLRALRPDYALVAALGETGLIVTAPGSSADFVSRYFGPAVGVPEDPVTGSAHCTLVPYWSRRLGRAELLAHQVSPRGGVLRCRDRGERVDIAGRVHFYLQGHIGF